jgi:hypothetical protein
MATNGATVTPVGDTTATSLDIPTVVVDEAADCRLGDTPTGGAAERGSGAASRAPWYHGASVRRLMSIARELAAGPMSGSTAEMGEFAFAAMSK